MNAQKSGLTGLFAARTARRQETADRRRVERELASFVSESEKAELSAILERHAEDQGVEIHNLISERVLAGTEYRAA
jgi:hypothetical protein